MLSLPPVPRWLIGFANNRAGVKRDSPPAGDELTQQSWEKRFNPGHNKLNAEGHQQQAHNTGDDVDSRLPQQTDQPRRHTENPPAAEGKYRYRQWEPDQMHPGVVPGPPDDSWTDCPWPGH